MARKLTDAKSDEFSITLPTQAVETIMELVPSGLFGGSRGEVVRYFVLQRLADPAVRAILAEERAKKAAAATP